MPRFNKSNYFIKTKKEESDELVIRLAEELSISEDKINDTLRGCGISLSQKLLEEEYSLYKELVCCKFGILEPYCSSDEAFQKELDDQIKGFDEIYIDTAPLIHEDWFLSFIANAAPVLRRRRKKLVILEKTMEELHGLKNNAEKDKAVRLRALIRPVLIQNLAKKGLIKRMDTGSVGIADDHLVSLFRRRGKYQAILLITQDRELSERVVCLEEDLNKNIEIPRHSFLERLFKKQIKDEDIRRKIIASKILEEGKLLRIYICPNCKDSYYDKLYDCEGFVICSTCYYDLKKAEEKEQIKIDHIKLLENLEGERRKQELEEIFEEKKIIDNTLTVAKVLKRKKLKIQIIISLILLSILIVFYFIF